jgi:hypothetical protein
MAPCILLADGTGTLAQWFAAIGTLLAVVVALFLQLYLPWRRRPKLQVEHATGGRFLLPIATGDGTRREYARVGVVNKGYMVARSCRGYLVKVERFIPALPGWSTLVEDTVPLAWSFVGPDLNARGIDLSPRVPHYLNLGWTDQVSNSLYLDLVPAPTYRDDLIKEHGEYRLTVQISAEGAEPALEKFKLMWRGEWNNWAVTREVRSRDKSVSK